MKIVPFEIQDKFLSKAEFENPRLVFDALAKEDKPLNWHQKFMEAATLLLSGSICQQEDPIEKGSSLYYIFHLLKSIDATIRIHEIQSKKGPSASGSKNTKQFTKMKITLYKAKCIAQQRTMLMSNISNETIKRFLTKLNMNQ